jgi:hypothetical protein
MFWNRDVIVQQYASNTNEIKFTYDASFSAIELKSLTRQLFLCVKVLKVYTPWYAPMPLWPTPPKGKVSTETANQHNLL